MFKIAKRTTLAFVVGHSPLKLAIMTGVTAFFVYENGSEG
jgi:hypothetical protein